MEESKARKPVKSSKPKYLYISLFVIASSYTVFDTAMNWKLTPSQEQIQYTFGLVGIDSNDGVTTVSVLPSASLKDRITFGCGYSMKSDSQSNQCLDASLLTPLKGSVATVGWYKLKSVFGHQNPYPQLMSLEINNKYIKSYNETKVINQGYNRARGFLTFLTLFIYFVILQFILFVIRKKSNKAEL